MKNSLDPNLLKGKIVICDRGSIARVAKGPVMQKACGVGMILASGMSTGEDLVGDAHVIPVAALGANEGDAMKSYILSSAPNCQHQLPRYPDRDQASSSSGLILESWPERAKPRNSETRLDCPRGEHFGSLDRRSQSDWVASDKRRTEFSILSGTLMACPHVSVAAALLKSGTQIGALP